jgi:hypothetical protein
MSCDILPAVERSVGGFVVFECRRGVVRRQASVCVSDGRAEEGVHTSTSQGLQAVGKRVGQDGRGGAEVEKGGLREKAEEFGKFMKLSLRQNDN